MLRPETVLAFVLALRSRESLEVGYRRDIVTSLKSLRDGGFLLHGLRLRPTPSGWSSAEASDFVGRMVSAGYSTQESPIVLTESGRELLLNHVRKAYEDPDTRREIIRAAELLGTGSDELEELLLGERESVPA